jgi:UDP-N-acetylglucosamine/UDP-N-acetylgalactosamine diphosphorylase
LGEFTEIGSGVIHFNFTPRGDKATATMLGNVVDGVFLDQARLFVAGNASLIGPLAADFGAVTLAGGRYTRQLRAGLNAADSGQPPSGQAFDLDSYGSIKRIFDTQVGFVGELAALDAWYAHVRARMAQGHPARSALYERARATVRLNLAERIAQLAELAHRMEGSARRIAARHPGDARIAQHEALQRHWPEVERHLRRASAVQGEPPGAFLRELDRSLEGGSEHYTAVVRRLSPAGRAAGRVWLQSIRARVAAPEILATVPAL